MVLVRVVVRDSGGKAIGTLNREDFEVFDNRKQQVISNFNLLTVKHDAVVTADSANPAAPAPAGPSASASTPQRFLGLYFDDVNAATGDLIRGRDAAQKFVATSLQPSDRVGAFTARPSASVLASSSALCSRHYSSSSLSSGASVGLSKSMR
jgi:VWFA-related protein